MLDYNFNNLELELLKVIQGRRSSKVKGHGVNR